MGVLDLLDLENTVPWLLEKLGFGHTERELLTECVLEIHGKVIAADQRLADLESKVDALLARGGKRPPKGETDA